MQRLFAPVLLVVPLCNAYDGTGMAFPRPHERYDSIVNGEIIVQDLTRPSDENLELFRFPCGRAQYDPGSDVERVQIPLNGDSLPTFPLHLAQTQDAPKNSTAVYEEPRGHLRRLTTIHWLHYQGSPLLEDKYSQQGFIHRTDEPGTEEWCDPRVNAPSYAAPFGRSGDPSSIEIDWSAISDLNATLALRYRYLNITTVRDIRVTTECCHVRFTTDQVDMPQCPATATGQGNPGSSGPGDLSRGATMGVVFGSVAAGVILLYVFCRYCLPAGCFARSRKPSARNDDASSMAEPGNCGTSLPVPTVAQAAPFDGTHVGPGPDLPGTQRGVAEGDEHSKAVVAGEEPPRYDDNRPPGYRQVEAPRYRAYGRW